MTQLHLPFMQPVLAQEMLEKAQHRIEKIETMLRLCSWEEGWDRLSMFWVCEGDLGLPSDCNLVESKKYSYQLAVLDHSWEIFPVYQVSIRSWAPNTLKWLLRGDGVPGLGRLCKTLHEAQSVASNRAFQLLHEEAERIRESCAKYIRRRLDEVARDLAPDQDTYERVRPGSVFALEPTQERSRAAMSLH